MPTRVVDVVLEGAARLGLTDGQCALLLLDTGTPVNATSRLEMNMSFILPSNTSDAAVTSAAESLMILKAHAVPLANFTAVSYKVCNNLLRPMSDTQQS